MAGPAKELSDKQIEERIPVLSLLGVHSTHVNDLHDVELVLFVLRTS